MRERGGKEAGKHLHPEAEIRKDQEEHGADGRGQGEHQEEEKVRLKGRPFGGMFERVYGDVCVCSGIKS